MFFLVALGIFFVLSSVSYALINIVSFHFPRFPFFLCVFGIFLMILGLIVWWLFYDKEV